MDFICIFLSWNLLRRTAWLDRRPYSTSHSLLQSGSMGMEKFHPTGLCQGKSSGRTIDWKLQPSLASPMASVLLMSPSIYVKFKSWKKVYKICFDYHKMWCNSIRVESGWKSVEKQIKNFKNKQWKCWNFFIIKVQSDYKKVTCFVRDFFIFFIRLRKLSVFIAPFWKPSIVKIEYENRWVWRTVW